MINKRASIFCLLLAVVTAFSFSCKKVVDSPSNGGDGAKLDTAGSNLFDRLYDSLYLYASQTYYWNDQLPSYEDFLPRNFENNDTLTGLANEQFQLTRFAKDGSGNLYEQLLRPSYDANGNVVWNDDNSAPKYSYILKTSETINGGASSFVGLGNKNTNLFQMTLDGKDSSLGFIPSLVTIGAGSKYDGVIDSTKDITLCIIQWVTKYSPAYNAGLRRGDLVLKINGKEYPNWTDADVDELNQAINARQITLTIRDGETGTKTKNLSFKKELYTFNPIFKDTVINKGGKRIGYLAFQTFSLNAIDSLNQAFQQDLKGVTDLVVDLRYNGGGYVAVAEHLINLIAPSSADDQIMYKSYYNADMSNHKAPILKNIPIDYDNPKGGSLADVDFSSDDDDNPNTTVKIEKGKAAAGLSNLTNVYFIVSSGTASASELTINSLKPYLGVTLIGAAFGDDGDRTYGKPVGFFEIRFGKYSMWMPNFETKNKDDEGGYYTGMPTDDQSFDDVAHDLGDPKEESFADAIAKILTNKASANIQTKSIRRSIIGARSVGEVIKTDKMIIKPVRFKK